MQPFLLAILSGLLLAVSFPETEWHFLAWIALVPFLFAVEGRDWRETLRIGAAAGVAFWWSLFYWLNNVTVAGFLVLTLYLALYFPAFGVLMNLLSRRPRVPAWLAAPIVWTALEYGRTYAFTGLPWGLAGVTQYRVVPLIQIAAVTGVYGVSFLVLLVNAAIYECARRRRPAPAAAAAVAVGACLAWGGWWLAGEFREGRGPRVAIVQGNVPQEEKFGEGFRDEIVERFRGLTLGLRDAAPDLIVWPETSIPGYYWYDPVLRGAVAALQMETRTPLLFGSTHMTDIERPKFFNSAFLVGPNAETVGRYDKIHLVLFGEIIPCKRLLPFLMRFVPFEEDFTPGDSFTVFPFGKGDFSALICFEDIMPDLARGFVRRGARFLVNVTNDAWFGRTSQPYQHVAHAVFRSVENCVSMVRATNTGVSCFIDPHGRITRVLTDGAGRALFVAGTATAEVPLTRVSTFYTRHGNVFAAACAAAAAALVSLALVPGGRRSRL
ncbi:MAG: apolipoprotein N-acyltransferase [bacterium]|nr:apolipoprotein N-acyltransferase [bacterium]